MSGLAMTGNGAAWFGDLELAAIKTLRRRQDLALPVKVGPDIL
jgi:hypothetical protein